MAVSPLCRSLPGRHRLKLDHREVAAALERVVLVENERESATHARGEVAAGAPEYDDCAAGHVFAGVIAHAFNDRGCSAVADRKSLSGSSAKERFAARRAVECSIADQHGLVWKKLRRFRMAGMTMRPPESPLPT